MNVPFAVHTVDLEKNVQMPIDPIRREVGLQVMHDPEIYRLELERLWGKLWIVVGHESEIPEPGDFMSRYIGEDPIIVTRTSKGEIHAMLNLCPHRGMQVCRAEMGSSTTFRCPYHGWAFGLDGRFLGAPVSEQKMHGDVMEKSELGLRKAKVEVFCGLIFATFDENAPPLKDHLGDAAWYLELMFGRTKNGMEAIGPPQRWIVDGNWKMAAEQFVGGDSFHTFTLHRSCYDMNLIGRAEDITASSAPAGDGVDVWFPQGHSFRCVATDFSPMFGESRAATMTPREKLLALPPPGCTPAMVEEMLARFDADQLRILADWPPTVGGIFPNVATFSFLMPHPDGQLAAVTGIHTFVPKGPDKLEFWHWTLVEKDSTDEFKKLVAQTTLLTNGIAGIIETDDGECWPAMYRAGKGAVASGGTLKFHAIIGENRPADWPAGGIASYGFSKDDGQWQYWLRYKEILEASGGAK